MTTPVYHDRLAGRCHGAMLPVDRRLAELYPGRGCANLSLFDDHPGRNGCASAPGVRPDRDRSWVDADSSDGIPVTNLSVSPARSTGPALFVGGWAIEQLWPLRAAPIVGAFLAGLTYPALAGESGPPETRRAATSR